MTRDKHLFEVAAVVAATLLLTPLAHAESSTSLPIINGAQTWGDRPVVGLSTRLGMIGCTGTLISPRVVLTAGHCLGGFVSEQVYVGTDPEVDGAFVNIASKEAYPLPDEGPAVDLALVLLERALPVTPVRLNDVPLTEADVGRAVDLVGFGVVSSSPDASSGRKLATTTDVVGVDPGLVGFGPGGCSGDSGGPVFMGAGDERVLVGVIHGGSAECMGGGVAVRVDAYRDWIDSRTAALDPPACGLDTRCATDCEEPDPDCVVSAIAETPAGGCNIGIGGGGAQSWLVLAALVMLALGRGRRRRVAGAGALLLAALAGCTDESPGVAYRCIERPFGHSGELPELDVVAKDGDGHVRALDDGVAPLATLPSGGRGLLVSADATNVEGCSVSMRALLRDLATDEVLAAEGALVDLESSGRHAGWGGPDPADRYGFIPFAAEVGRRYDLELKLEDRNGARAARRVSIITAAP